MMLVVSDVDRTVVDAGRSEGPACSLLFEKLTRNGIPYIFATSRSPGSLMSVLPRSAPGAAYHICADGCLSLRRSSASTNAVFSVVDRVTLDDAELIVSEVLADHVDVFSLFAFLDDHHDYGVGVVPRLEHEGHLQHVLGDRLSIPIGTALSSGSVLSLGLLGREPDCRRMARNLRAGPRCATLTLRVYEELRTGPGLWWCDISAGGVDKASALNRLLGREGFTGRRIRPIVGLGDGDNDVGMARAADLFYCPPWASASLKRVALVVDAVDCEGFVGAVDEMMTTGMADEQWHLRM